MKNYNVKVIKSYYDNEQGKPMIPNDIFKCSKERYLLLKENKVVELIGIDKEEIKSKGKVKPKITKDK